MVDLRLLFEQSRERYADRPVYTGSGVAVSFAELAARVRDFERRLQAHGVVHGESVVLDIEPGIDHVAALLGAWQLGASVALASRALMSVSLHRILASCQADVFVRTDAQEPEGVALCRLGRSSPSDVARRRARGECLVVFSAGSSSPPKGIVHTRASLGAMLSHTFALYPEPLDLCTVPMTGLAGVQMLALSLRDGVPLPRFVGGSPDVVERAVAVHQPRRVWLFPALMASLVAAAAGRPSLLSSMQVCHSGGDVLSPELVRAFKALSGGRVLHAFGLAECGPVLMADEDDPAVFSTLCPQEVSVCLRRTTDGQLAQPGEVGQLFVHSPSLLMGYLRENGEPVGAGEWLASGALFQQREDGRLQQIGPDMRRRKTGFSPAAPTSPL